MAASNIPDWLTSDFLKSCLQADESKHQIVVTNYSVEPAVPAGNNYGSHMFRVKVDYKTQNDTTFKQSISLILKSPLTGGFMEEFGDSIKDIYEREPKYYREFITETYKLSKHDIVPRHYVSTNSLCVVLEDLKSTGYVMADRHNLLDFDHCQLYIKASAKLHALSVAVYKKKPQLIESLVHESSFLVEKIEKIYKTMIKNSLQCMAAYLEDKPDYIDYFNIINEASEDDMLWKLFVEMQGSSQLPLKVLLQTDPWCANMMFKYNEDGVPVGVKLFDFQNLKFTSPVMEFAAFIWTSVNPKVRESQLNDLCQLYCDSLNRSLEELECSERLSLQDFKAEMISFSPMVLYNICTTPLCIADNVADLNELVTVDFSKNIKGSLFYKLYQGVTFNKYFPKVLDQAAKEGVFDYLREKINLSKSA